MSVGDWQSQSKKYYLSLCSAEANSRMATDDIWGETIWNVVARGRFPQNLLLE